LEQARAAALGAELAEDGEGAVEMGEGLVKSWEVVRCRWVRA